MFLTFAALFIFYLGGFSSAMERAFAHPYMPLQCTGEIN